MCATYGVMTEFSCLGGTTRSNFLSLFLQEAELYAYMAVEHVSWSYSSDKYILFESVQLSKLSKTGFHFPTWMLIASN